MKKFGYFILAVNCFAVSSVFADEAGEASEVVVIVEEGSEDSPRLFGCGCGGGKKKGR
jgi:hypothetical protein